MNDLIAVGTISGAYGVRGEVRIKSFCAVPEDIEGYSPLATDEGRVIHLSILRPIKNGFVVRIAEISTKEHADEMKGTVLYARREQLPSLPDDEFYHTDLMGLDVFDTGGNSLGKVKAVQNHGATDLLELHLPGRTQTVLLPFTREIVPTVDLDAGRIVADPPEGLI